MSIVDKLTNVWAQNNHPFLIAEDTELRFSDLFDLNIPDLSEIKPGDVVAIIGDFCPESILLFLRLIDKAAIIVPLTRETHSDHEYFFETAVVNYVIELNKPLRKITRSNRKIECLERLRRENKAGLVLFSTGTTGRPKAILHNFSSFLRKFESGRPAFRTLNFLLFDHIGGINTLFHTLYNKGVIVVPKERSVDSILDSCQKYHVEVLPTSPTFLRMLLLSGTVPSKIPESLKVITYGTERMDQFTLSSLAKMLPQIDFRQTYGMSELGILRVKSYARDSLFMKVGGEGVKTRIKNGILEIQSAHRMIGYMNHESPFDADGWYNTKDTVELLDSDPDFFRITGRTSEVINVGGLKVLASEIERIVLEINGVIFAKAFGKPNPITGEHIELQIEVNSNFEITKEKIRSIYKEKVQGYMVPQKISFIKMNIGHRFKRL